MPVAVTPPLRTPWLAGALLTGAVLATYARFPGGAFVFDDVPSITENPTIRSFATALFPPGSGLTVSGRPLLNLTFAFNHALSGEAVWSYHALNLLIHLLAALTLFSLLRRTFRLPVLAPRFGAAADSLALGSAALWALHPLQTESVTYIVQRAESLVGLWYLLVLYGLVRAAGSATPQRWLAGSWIACLLGMFTKEVMVTAPVLAVLFQVALVDGSWRAAWARRGKFFALLALTWVPLAFLVAHDLNRGGSAGLGLGVSPWAYALTQCRAIILYLRLSFWPQPLIADYGNGVAHGLAEVWPQALALAALLAATAVAWCRKLPAAFAGAWFFLILAPSSSVVPVMTQTIAEHRIYLPLAAVIVLVVTGVHALAGRRSWFVLGALALLLGGLTARRNEDYRTPLAFWRDAVAKAPANPRAHNNLGNILDDAGQGEAAAREYDAALQADPHYALARYNRARLLARAGRLDEAIADYREAIRLDPASAETHTDLGNLFASQARWADAQAEFEAALRIAPGDALAHNNLANILFNQGHAAEAVREFEAAEAGLDNSTLHLNLATALATVGRTNEAIAHFQTALRRNPLLAQAHCGLGAMLLRENRRDEGLAELREALRLQPGYPEAQQLLTEAGAGTP